MNSSAPIPKLPNSTAPAAAPVTAPAAGFHLPSYLLGLTTALVLLGAALFFWPRPQPAAVQLQPPPTSAPTPSLPPAEATAPPAPLVVFVSGAVAQPGLYTLAPTARIGDALAAAGGLLPSVDPALINQAQPLVDGAQLHIPAPTAAAILTQAAPSVENPLVTNTESMQAAPVVEPAQSTLPASAPAAPTLPPVAVSEPPAGLSVAAPLALPTPTAALAADALPARAATVNLSAGGGLINVNTATSAELESLPAIGPAKAQAIIANRPYATVDELDRVPGIGPATLEQIRPYVTTQ